MSLELPFGIKILNPIPLDWYYGPYVDLTAACAAVPEEVRYDGLTVQITGTGEFHWLEDDLTDTGLVAKGGGGGHVIQSKGSDVVVRGILNFRNGFTLTDNDPSTDVVLGGLLLDEIQFDGDGGTYGFEITDVSTFSVNSSGAIELIAVEDGAITLTTSGAGTTTINGNVNFVGDVTTNIVSIGNYGTEFNALNIYTTGFSIWDLGETGEFYVGGGDAIDGGGAVYISLFGLQLSGGGGSSGGAWIELTNNGLFATAMEGDISIVGNEVPIKLRAEWVDMGVEYTSIILTPDTVPTIIAASDAALFAGIQYGADYSANFTDESLINKGFADATYATFASSSFWNRTGTSTHTGNVTINGAGFFTAFIGGRFSFAAGATYPAINIGGHSSDPSSPANGDVYYNITANELRARINGAWVALGAGGGGSHVIENAGTPLTARANLNFSNGLTASDNTPDTDVKFGGALTANTTISGAYAMNFGDTGLQISSFRAHVSGGQIHLRSDSGTVLIEAGSGAISIGGSPLNLSSSTIVLGVLATTIMRGVIGDFSNPKGGDIIFKAGDAYTVGNNDGGDLYITYGAKNGTGKDGNIAFLGSSVNWQSMERGVYFANATVVPTGNPTDGVFMYSFDISGNAAPHFRNENGDIIKLFKGAALTTPDGTLGNAVARIAELEARLQAHGLLA